MIFCVVMKKQSNKKTEITLDEDAQTAFKTSKQGPPTVAYVDYIKPFKLHADASALGLGAILYQRQDGRLIVFAHASQDLNNPLSYALITAKYDATGYRYLAELSTNRFSIKYKSGRLNTDANTLSRLPEVTEITENAMKSICSSLACTTSGTWARTILPSRSSYPTMSRSG